MKVDDLYILRWKTLLRKQVSYKEYRGKKCK